MRHTRAMPKRASLEIQEFHEKHAMKINYNRPMERSTKNKNRFQRNEAFKKKISKHIQ